MKKEKQITIYYFLKNHHICLLHCICDLATYIFENIHGTQPQIEGTVRHATSIRLKRSAYGNENIRTQSHFWYVQCLVCIKNPGPLRFELTRFHCTVHILNPNNQVIHQKALKNPGRYSN